MANRRTWLWILAAVLGVIMVCIIAMAGFGMYFVSNHVHAGPSTSTDAFRAFDDVNARFKEAKPIYELDDREHPRQLRQLSELPTSSTKAENMWILAWDSDRERLVKVSLPFWMLRLGRQKIDVMNGGFNFERLELDVNELQRVGPVLLLDYRASGGKRVMVWTQ